VPIGVVIPALSPLANHTSTVTVGTEHGHACTRFNNHVSGAKAVLDGQLYEQGKNESA
jgi:hypothetical protein